MTTADVIAEMKALLTRHAEVKREIDRLQLSSSAYRSPLPDGMPKGAPLRLEVEEVARLLDAKTDELQEIEQELSVFRRRLEPLIHTIPDSPQRLMMRLRYIHWMPVRHAAAQAGYSREYAYQLLGEGERRLSE